MNREINPYAVSHHATSDTSSAIRRYLGRSVVTGLLAAITLSTGLLLFWIDSVGTIDLGKFGLLALGSLFSATIALLVAFRLYSLGLRKYAIASLVTALLFFVPLVLIAFHESGIFTFFLFA